MPARQANTNTGQRDHKGRIIWRGPRGGLFVRTAGNKKRPVAVLKMPAPTGALPPLAPSDRPHNAERPSLSNLPPAAVAHIMRHMNHRTLARFAAASKEYSKEARATMRGMRLADALERGMRDLLARRPTRESTSGQYDGATFTLTYERRVHRPRGGPERRWGELTIGVEKRIVSGPYASLPSVEVTVAVDEATGRVAEPTRIRKRTPPPSFRFTRISRTEAAFKAEIRQAVALYNASLGNPN